MIETLLKQIEELHLQKRRYLRAARPIDECARLIQAATRDWLVRHNLRRKELEESSIMIIQSAWRKTTERRFCNLATMIIQNSWRAKTARHRAAILRAKNPKPVISFFVIAKTIGWLYRVRTRIAPKTFTLFFLRKINCNMEFRLEDSILSSSLSSILDCSIAFVCNYR